jgi:histidine triad (HIT) family protein
MDATCIFCRIAAGEIPAKTVYRSDAVVAIEDLNPQAPVHLLVLPVAHFAGVSELSQTPGTEPVAAELLAVASQLGRERGEGRGFRIAINTGEHGGQTVGHLHLHVLAGRALGWPPG